MYKQRWKCIGLLQILLLFSTKHKKQRIKKDKTGSTKLKPIQPMAMRYALDIEFPPLQLCWCVCVLCRLPSGDLFS